MIHPWYSTSRVALPFKAAAISTAAHVALIAGLFAWTRTPTREEVQERVERSPFYVPPPARAVAQAGARETLRFFEVAPRGLDAGLGIPSLAETRGPVLVALEGTRASGADTMTTPEMPALDGLDLDAYTEVDVDSVAARDPTSVAPAYPPELLAARIEGMAALRFVVDSTGQADSASVHVMYATHPAFADAVRAALPRMRFSPAVRRGVRVRQLVEQEFAFRIARSDSTVAPPATPAPVAPLRRP